ncbi:Gfo/Idh/MocA family protein [Mucilaginibacter sp. X4EP1]|uniref:Gfo/Idh/MocA family protein n=1 Tax=Mucilaginibacter sp. X4EP1 TaxID=2723092 RepID=UPI0021694080|nr:Gfo/Idh/MocA family oxidoreductase [Mucilaginibacter sp. X4EP1]MCS3812966.1 putative dehydrogenase [Mucilaginibacter sp. X4EP1]
MSKSLGIIGCGAVTQNQYLKALGMYHDIAVKYVFDINQELAHVMAAQFGANVVTKEELLSNSDIVVIATPPSTHFQLINEALKKGNKVICEKPFVGSVADCKELIKVAAAREAELYVAHFRRTFPSVQLAQSIIKSKILGNVLGIEVYEGGRFSWQTQSGYVYKDPYGGVLFDTGSHTIDMALFMANIDTGEFEPEVISITKDKSEPSHEIAAELKLKSSAYDINLKVKLSRKLLLSNKVKIICENGYMDIPAGMANYVRIGSKLSSTVVYSDTKYDDLMDCFAIQFNDMFYDKPESIFSAGRFLNLTKILEVIANK